MDICRPVVAGDGRRDRVSRGRARPERYASVEPCTTAIQIELQPDVLVGRLADFTAKDLPYPPVLAVEVLSPSTALIDLNTEKAGYERLGVACYWVIDPIELELTVFELTDGKYVEAGRVRADQPFEATRPYAVRIVLTDLLAPFG